MYNSTDKSTISVPIPWPQTVADLGVVFKNFFDSRTGQRKGTLVNQPKCKRKSDRPSARFIIKGEKVYLANIGKLKTVWSKPLPNLKV